MATGEGKKKKGKGARSECQNDNRQQLLERRVDKCFSTISSGGWPLGKGTERVWVLLSNPDQYSMFSEDEQKAHFTY